MVIGLTGQLCSGKDLAANVFTEAGWLVIDEDALGHEALRVMTSEIVQAFGETVLDESGEISRRDLGAIVFQSPQSLARLESIVHPWMVSETRRRVDGRESEHAVINAAILFKMGLHVLCDTVLIVRAPFLLRLLRCLRRDGLGLRRVIERMARQRSLNRVPKGVDTITVWNAGTMRRFVTRISRLFLRTST